jgi:hypothetical protein
MRNSLLGQITGRSGCGMGEVDRRWVLLSTPSRVQFEFRWHPQLTYWQLGHRKTLLSGITEQLSGTLDQGAASLSFSSGDLLASTHNGGHSFTPDVTTWNMENHTPSAAFKFDSSIWKLALSSDGSWFYTELARGDSKFFDIAKEGNQI